MQTGRLNVLDDASVNRALETIVLVVVVGGTVVAWALARIISRRKLLLHRLVHGWQEDNLAVGSLRHGLHSFKVTDLHGRSRGQDIGSLTHQLGRLDLGAGGDDLALTDSLGLSSHGERILQIIAEDDILDEHGLNLDTPARGDLLDYLCGRLGDLLAALDHVLQHAGTNDVAQGGLGALDEGLLDVGDAKGGLVRGGDLVVDDRGQVEGNVVLGHADLAGHFDNLDLHVDGGQVLAEGVDLDQTGVDGAFESTKLRYETDLTLVDRLEWVGAADTAGDGTAETDTISQVVD